MMQPSYVQNNNRRHKIFYCTQVILSILLPLVYPKQVAKELKQEQLLEAQLAKQVCAGIVFVGDLVRHRLKLWPENISVITFTPMLVTRARPYIYIESDLNLADSACLSQYFNGEL